MAQIFPIDFEEKLTMAQDDYILFSDSEDGNKIKKAQYKNLKGEKGDTGTAATISVGTTTTGAAGTSASVTNVGTSSAAVFNFTIPKGDKGDTGQTGAAIVSAEFNGDDIDFTEEDGNVVTLSNAKTDLKGDKGDTGLAATISVGTTTTLDAGDNATVTNSGTSSAAVFNFGIPKGDTGDTGPTGNGIASVTSSKAGKTTTVTITETNGDSSSFTVEDGADGQGSGDVLGPNSSTNGDIVLFDGTTGKLIKDSGVGLSSKLDATALSNNAYGGSWNGDSTHTPTKDALYDKIHTMDVEIGNKAADTSVVKLTGNQTIAGTKTFSTSPVVPSKTADATNTGTAIATEAQVYKVDSKVSDLFGLGKFLSLWNAATGQPISFPLDTPYTYTTGDYFLVETVSSATPPVNYKPNGSSYTGTASSTTESGELEVGDIYIYDGSTWLLQLNHGKTVSFSEIAGSPSDNTALGNALGAKQDSLTLPSTPTQGNLVAWGADNKTFTDGGAIPTGVPSGGTDGQVLSKVSGSVAWATPSGGDVMVSSQSGNILTTGMKIWAGTQANYESLGTYDNNTVYLTI